MFPKRLRKPRMAIQRTIVLGAQPWVARTRTNQNRCWSKHQSTKQTFGVDSVATATAHTGGTIP